MLVCNKCGMVEMKMEKVNNDMMFFKCRQCGNEIEKTIYEVEEFNKSKD